MQKNFSAQVSGTKDRAVLLLHGEIDSFAETELQDAYQTAEQQGQPVILLDFSQVTYINSTGLALIVRLMARSRKIRRRLMACGLSEHYLEIFQISRLADYVEIVSDPAAE